ncbi:hypothetical protein [Phenylobacterium sp.]|jgi:hypothetical protein|uniref:hypothetical protein n=1 Tax=Phenylobacterium sp. TaxID=1871053 RepID=UPI002F3F9C5C
MATAPTTVSALNAKLDAYVARTDARLAKLEAAAVPPVIVAPPPAPTPPASKPLMSKLPPGVGQLLFDEPFTDQSRMAWHPVFNPKAPWKRSAYYGQQIDQGWEDAGSRQGANDLQVYTDAYYPTAYRADGSGVTDPPGTQKGVETVRIVGGQARLSLLANPDPANGQLQQYYGGHPTPSGTGVKRLGALLTTERSFAQEYGYFLARLNTDALTPGCWPAFWLLPTPGTMGLSPEWKELDAYEGMINEPRRAFITYHGGDGLSIWPDLWTPGWHDIGLLVTANSISTVLDGVVVPGSVKANKYPRGTRWYMLLDLAVGGWDGQEAMEAPALPAYMTADYVKAFAVG